MRANIETVRRLGSSRFNYWFGYVANGAWVLWFAHFGLPVVGPHPLPLLQAAGYLAAGFVLWTFLEYALHRYIYHVIPSFLSQGHALHHERPRELIGVPWWLTSVALWGIWAGLARTFAPGPLGLVMAGTWAGYIAYCLVHHGSHHWRMQSGYLRRVKQLHQLHHVYPETNWGFTTHLWDVVFGTYVSPAEAKRRQRARAQSASAGAAVAPGAGEHVAA